jgi:hypothetical protein
MPTISRTTSSMYLMDRIPNNSAKFSKTLDSIANYILRENKNGMACIQTIRNLTPEILDKPERPDNLNDLVKLAIFNEEVREYVKNKKSYKG